MLTWPHGHTDWVDRLDAVERTFLEIAAAICRFEHLVVTACDEAHAVWIGRRLVAAAIPRSRFAVYVAPSNDTWARDHGPITVENPKGVALVDFRFNGWGYKYAHDLDDAITATLHRQGGFGATPLESVDLVLEGGGIETDGAGSLLATETCLLSKSRNPDITRDSLEATLRTTLGIRRFLWLKVDPLQGDDTDGHIDTLARFCNASTIAYVQCPDDSDPHYESLRLMERQLRALTGPDGKPFDLVPLPWPGPRYDERGRRLPATYANFLIINDAVLMPAYRDPADEAARETLRQCFPEREIIAIDCSTLIRQNGSLHCVAMHLPRGTLPRSNAS